MLGGIRTCNINLNHSLDYKTANGDQALLKTISKMKLYIKYIEKEYKVKILGTNLNRRKPIKERCFTIIVVIRYRV